MEESETEGSDQNVGNGLLDIGGLAECSSYIFEGRGREISDEEQASCLPCRQANESIHPRPGSVSPNSKKNSRPIPASCGKKRKKVVARQEFESHGEGKERK